MFVYVSESIVPIIFLLVVLYGFIKKQEVYGTFVKGVKEGFFVVFDLAPTLIGLFLAIHMFRASGLLDFIINIMEPAGTFLHIPSPVMPVIVTKMFSSSAATGLMLDIFKNNGPDSKEGMLASVILSSTETIFYTMSVYYGAVNVKKIRWTLAGALFSMAAGVAASVVILL